MINYNFNIKVVSDAMYQFFRAYYKYNFIDYIRPIYRLIREFTKSKIRSSVCAVLFSFASFTFAKAKHRRVHHRRPFIILTAVCAKFLLGTSIYQ